MTHRSSHIIISLQNASKELEDTIDKARKQLEKVKELLAALKAQES